MALLDVFRRSTPSVIETLAASGEMINLDDQSAIQAALSRREKWQEQTYDAYDTCGLIHNGVNHLAEMMSRITLFVAEVPAERNLEPTPTKDEAVIKEMDRLGSNIEVGELLDNFTRQQMMPGECYLCGIQPGETLPGEAARPETERWVVVSPFEMDFAGGKGARILDYHNNRPLTLSSSKNDTWIRLWRQHPRRKNRPDSPLRPLLDTVDELLWWEAVASARAKSRITDSGILAIPSNMELPAQAGDDKEARMSGAQRVIKRIMDTIVKTIQNPRTASSVAPILLTYPWNERGVSGIEHIKIERPNDELIQLRTKECKETIAQGFPLPPESFFGLSTANDWTGGTIEDAKFKENVEPFVVFAINALTTGWLRPILTKRGIDAKKYLIWYDASNVIAHPDMTQAADKGVELGGINLKAWRKVRGFDEGDEPTPEEREEMLEWMRGLRGKEEFSRPTDDPRSDVKDTNQPAEPGKQPAKPMPTPAARGKGQQIAQSVQSTNGNGQSQLLTAFQVYCDMAIRRSLEIANNRLRNRANKNTGMKSRLKDVETLSVASTIGREGCAKLDLASLFDDCFIDAPRRFVGISDAYSTPIDMTPTMATALIKRLETSAAEYLFKPLPDGLVLDTIYIQSLATPSTST